MTGGAGATSALNFNGGTIIAATGSTSYISGITTINVRNGTSTFNNGGFNATAPAVQAVKDGAMTATLGVDLTSAGKLLVDQIPDIVKAGDDWQPKSFIPGYTIVSKDNVDQILKSNPQ